MPDNVLRFECQKCFQACSVGVSFRGLEGELNEQEWIFEFNEMVPSQSKMKHRCEGAEGQIHQTTRILVPTVQT